MADEYDPTDCELGICGPCDACMEQDDQRVRDELGDEEPRGDFIELGDGIPEVRNVSYDPTSPERQEGETLREYQERTERTPIGTIDLTPSWVTVVGIYLELLDSEGADHYKKAGAKKEILRAAALADLYVKEHKR